MAPRTIDLNRSGIRKEGKAGAAGIVPGQLLTRNTTAGDVVVHASAGETAIAMFALENDIHGKDITDVYADNDIVQMAVFPPGGEVYARLADSQTVAVGEWLESDGNGELQEVTADPATDTAERNSIVGRALEAVTTSGAIARIKIEVA